MKLVKEPHFRESNYYSQGLPQKIFTARFLSTLSISLKTRYLHIISYNNLQKRIIEVEKNRVFLEWDRDDGVQNSTFK